MKKLLLLSALALSACANDPNVQQTTADLFKTGCGAVSIADGYFNAAAPALVAAGKLSQADLANEQTIFKTAQAVCANPPSDPVQAGSELIATAGSIYMMLSVAPAKS